MITSPDNEQLKTIRKLQQKSWRDKLGLFAAEGEDLVEAAAAAGWKPEILLVAGEDVDPDLLAAASTLGSGTRTIGVYAQRWSEPGGDLSVYLHAVQDPGNVGAVIRSAHALADGPVILGPGCADPYGPKAVRASMGSIFARPPARANPEDLPGTKIALVRGEGEPLGALRTAHGAREVLLLGSEREGLPNSIVEQADHVAHIPLRQDAPDSLNVAATAAIALYDRANRMARHG